MNKCETYNKDNKDKGRKGNLWLVHVTTTLENGFESGCWVAVEASDPETAKAIAFNDESESVGSNEIDSDRFTVADDCVFVPFEAERFIRKTFSVITGTIPKGESK